MSAARGDRLRVPMTVAMEFAASLAPFTKPKPIAAATITASSAVDSGMLQHDAFQRIGHILSQVGRILKVLIELSPLDDITGILIQIE